MKKILREQIIQERNRLTHNEVSLKSHKILTKLFEFPFYQKANKIMLYIAFNNEVLTEPIIHNLFLNKKRVFIPVTIPKTKELIVSELLSLENDLAIGAFGLLEPKKGSLRPFSPQNIDLVIVPGLAFDSRGYRIGYGAGYYDRFLLHVPEHVPKVSLAFDLQIIDRVPQNNYDVPVQYIITETQNIHCTSNK